ncbi:MAG: GWxTD domain-containing protein [Bacteroidetes bacterium]|nr:GWxTD domain-containing protein [Bacteroidota bacterium]
MNSIITRKDGEEKVAKVIIEAIVEKIIGDQSQSFRKAYTINLAEEIETNINGQFEFTQQFPIESGFYKIAIQVTDLQTQKVATVGVETTVPNLDANKPELSNLVFLVKDKVSNEFKPYLTYSIPQRFDSLQLYAQFITANRPFKKATIKIDRILSDSLPARRLHEQEVLPGQLPFVGIDYRKTNSIYSNKLFPIRASSEKLLEVIETLPMPRTGNYVAHVQIDYSDTCKLQRDLYFSVKPSYFPRLKTIRELAEPLAYLMDDKEYRKMMQIQDADSMKKVIDSFWIRSLGNTRLAKQSLQLYYERVEQANRQFTTFKEGWKTDPGMIHILFGSPRVVDQIFRDVIWAYGMYQNQNYYDPTTTFVFIRVGIMNNSFPFEHYLLRRDVNYFQTFQRILEDWRSGANLID